MAIAIPIMMYAAAAASVASAVISVQDSKNQADASAEQQEIHNREQAKAMEQSYGDLSQVEQDALLEEADANTEMQKSYMQARGRVNTMAAAAGMAGNSVAVQEQGLARDRQSNLDNILATRQSKLDNVTNQARQIRSQGQAGMDYSPISRPSWAAGALKIGGTALSSFGGAYQGAKKFEMAQKVNGPTAGG
ncbi:hypothetical protein [Pseudomonas phage Alpheus]|uniref:Internal virion protein n=1 Tax=Pseudomonas phage Alpheus TaxID=2163983 RepID=A0A2S1GN02_9CAUD|nr:hypothetical protein HOT11_gp35 [Pseudomonas phage Alpheus]AWD90759.1 hypothetical protein [Pseudomonas phage Alpheus]